MRDDDEEEEEEEEEEEAGELGDTAVEGCGEHGVSGMVVLMTGDRR